MASGFTGALRTRPDVWKLSAQNPWHPDLLWYARAIASIHQAGITNPTWWRYQGAIHDYVVGSDPFAVQGEAMPPAAEQQAFWRQCQHGSWFFLPWHRMYLYYFEDIIASTVVSLGGPPDWALPYWNYSDKTNPDALSLPPAFRDAQTPDGATNPLLIAARARGMNTGAKMSRLSAGLSCLTEDDFTQTAVNATPGFGGPPLIHHDPGTGGALENVPHGSVHNAVGGPTGWMGAFNTAALDPIFWLHHSNIDRLWEIWRRRKPTNVNPPDAAWQSAIGAAFQFHDSAGAVGQLTMPSQVLDMTAAPLLYTYEDLSDPTAPAPPAAPVAQPLAVTLAAPTHPAELVGASLQPTALTSTPVVEHVDLSEPTGPAARPPAPVAGQPARRVYLHLENVRAPAPAPSYAVYINLPAGADPQTSDDNFAGLLSMFGVAEASRSTSEHGGDGLTYILNITDLVSRLTAKGMWDPKHVHVTFAPLTGDGPAQGVTVGRVSIYYH